MWFCGRAKKDTNGIKWPMKIGKQVIPCNTSGEMAGMASDSLEFVKSVERSSGKVQVLTATMPRKTTAK